MQTLAVVLWVVGTLVFVGGCLALQTGGDVGPALVPIIAGALTGMGGVVA